MKKMKGTPTKEKPAATEMSTATNKPQVADSTPVPSAASGQWPPLLYGCVAVLVAASGVLVFTVQELQKLQGMHAARPAEPAATAGGEGRAPRVWLAGNKVDSGYLKHVKNVFERLGYERGSEEDFDVLWSHPYPFRIYNETLLNIKSHQRVNHFPGSGFITSKVELSTSGIKHIPIAFKMPKEKEQLLDYAKQHPETLFVQKSNSHRDIKIASVDAAADLDDNSKSFFQEYIGNPLLVDGHKFDIGIYTIMTSLDPLRVYVYWGDVLLRFCAEEYHPFDPSVIDKYVVGDDYLPIWKVPSLSKYHNELKLGHRESLNAYLRSQGQRPEKIWSQIEASIRSVYLVKEPAMIRASSRFSRATRQFFEMVRFDFVVDDQLNVYLMEANMSPNLSSAHFRQNVPLYEQVVFSLLSLVGLAPRLRRDLQTMSGPVADMLATDKELAVFGQECGSADCQSTCEGMCRVCLPCLTGPEKAVLRQALLEHLNRHLARRILPPPTTVEEARTGMEGLQDLSSANRLMHLWFRGKCVLDRSWC